MKEFTKHMFELPNISLTSFIGIFIIAIAASAIQREWSSTIACLICVSFLIGMKYYAWKKQQSLTEPEKRQKVIVIKRK